MINAPRLLNSSNKVLLPNTLFSDLQIDKILSSQSIAVLQRPCEQSEIVRRNELFLLLDRRENVAHVENTLSALCATERALYLLKDAKIPLDIYYRQAELFESYLTSCDALASMKDLGVLFADIVDYYSSEASRQLCSEMKESVHKIRNLLSQMNAGLLSFADKNWLTPDYDAVSEIDSISECAKNLGFAVPKQKPQNTKINLSLSDAVCHLYSDKVAQIEAEFAKYTDVDFYEPIAYIFEIKFILEIHGLIQRATKLGVLHCIAKTSQTPQFIAKELYDVSLLAKNCVPK